MKQRTADGGAPGHIADHLGGPARVERAGVLDDHSGRAWGGIDTRWGGLSKGIILTEAGLPGHRAPEGLWLGQYKTLHLSGARHPSSCSDAFFYQLVFFFSF